MSVCAIITKQDNKEWNSFCIPVATERFFNESWKPIIDKLKLNWVSGFAIDIDITNDDYPAVKNELEILKSWINKQPKISDLDFILSRINSLIDGLNSLFASGKFTVFIG